MLRADKIRMLVYGGWFLMIPYTENAKELPLPLSKWTILQSFDTARECEDNLADRKRYQSERVKQQKKNELNFLASAIWNGLCLPTEAVYPSTSTR